MSQEFEWKSRARTAILQRYWPIVGISALYSLAICILGGASMGAAALVLAPILEVGYRAFTLHVYRGTPFRMEDLISGFSRFGRNLGAMLLSQLYIFLWSLLFLVPGIVKSYSYRMLPFLLADYPDMGAMDALALSGAMMRGYRGQLFVLDLTFVGWLLLDCITFGMVGLFYARPYYAVTIAGFYRQRYMEYFSSADRQDPTR